MAKSIYRRLTRRARRLESYSQLWLAPDHLLLLRSTRFHEHYRRFAFADIQAIVVTELPARLPLQVLLAVCGVGWTLLALAVGFWLFRGFFLASGALWLGLVIDDIARGPRCRCYLHTAVSRELLTPVNRMGIAREVLAKLQPAIEAVQGAIPAADLPQWEDRVAQPSSLESAPPEIVQKPGYLPEAVFGVFLINAALVLLSRFAPKFQISSIMTTTLPGEMLLVIVALLRAARDSRRYIYAMIGAGLLGIGWDFVEFARFLAHWFQLSVEAGQHGRPAPLNELYRPLFTPVHTLVAASWRVATAAVGLGLAYIERKRTGQVPQAPVAVAEVP